MRSSSRFTVPILVLSLVLSAGSLTCKKGEKPRTAPLTAEKQSPAASECRTETIDTKRIVTENYIGTPFDDTVAKFTPAGQEGAYKKYSLTIYASPMNSRGRVPDKAYVWTSALKDTKKGSVSQFYVIDSAKTLTGERYGYAYITGDILIADETDIVIITVFDGKVTAVDYYNPNGSRKGRRSAYQKAL